MNRWMVGILCVILFFIIFILGLTFLSVNVVKGYVPPESNLTFIDDFSYDGLRYKTMEDAYSRRRWIIIHDRNHLVVIESK